MFSPFQVEPLLYLRCRYVEFLGHLLQRKEHIAQDNTLSVILRRYCHGVYRSPYKQARVGEWAQSSALAHIEILGDLCQVALQLECGGRSFFGSRKSFREDPIAQDPFRCRLLPGHFLGEQLLAYGRAAVEALDEHPPAPLRHTIVRSIDHAPFHGIAQIGERSQHHGEVPAALACGRFQKTVHVLQQQIARPLGGEDAMDLPPQYALPARKPFGILQGAGHRIILARESAHQQIVLGDLLGRYSGNVGVAVPFSAEARYVDLRCRLPFGTGLPLVAPHHLEALRSTLQADAETAYAGKKLHYLQLLHPLRNYSLTASC